MLVTLSSGAVVGIGDRTLVDGTMMGKLYGTFGACVVVGNIVGRDVTSIFYRVLMACNFTFPIENGDD